MKLACVAAAALLAVASAVQAQELRIGMLTTQTGPGATIGAHMINGWKLGLEHEGWTKDGDKVASVPVRMFYADDQLKPDVGLKEVERLITREGIHIGAGFIWSHVMMAVRRPFIENKRIMLSTLTGPSIMAGKECTPYFVSTSWTNEQTAEAAGELLNGDNIKALYVLSPNYQAGKDVVAGMTKTYRGKVVDQSLYKLGENDFQADISKLRAHKPEAVFFFGPGTMGISFMKQWAASGAGKEVKLYAHYVVDEISIPAIGDAAVGTIQISSWPSDSSNEVNQRFVKDYVSKFGHAPSFFAAQAYDGPRLIAAALKKTGGKFDDPIQFMKVLRHTPYPSTRRYAGYNVNGLPIVDFYKSEVVLGQDRKPRIGTRGMVIANSKDAYWRECPLENRL